MTNLIVKTVDIKTNLNELVKLVRAERTRVQTKAPANAHVSCIIEHTVTFTSEGPIEKAHLKYGLSKFIENKMAPPTYEIKELVDGGDYIYDIIGSLIKAAAEDCIELIDIFAMNEQTIYSEDIIAHISNFVETSLKSIDVKEGYSVSTIAVAGGISQITITVS